MPGLPEPQSRMEYLLRVLCLILEGEPIPEDIDGFEPQSRLEELAKEAIVRAQAGGGAHGTVEFGNIEGNPRDNERLNNELDLAKITEWGDIQGGIDENSDLQQALDNAAATAQFANISGDVESNANLKTALDAIRASISTKATTQKYNATFLGSGWSAESPFTQTVNIQGVLETDTPIADIMLSSDTDVAKSESDAWAYVSRIDTASNAITALCLEKKPELDLNIQLKVVR